MSPLNLVMHDYDFTRDHGRQEDIDPIAGDVYHKEFSEAKLDILIWSLIKYAEYNLAP
jgi:hypothetical protein